MKIEIGKSYIGLVNGAVFSVVDRDHVKTSYGIVKLIKVRDRDGKVTYYSERYLEHLLIDEYNS